MEDKKLLSSIFQDAIVARCSLASVEICLYSRDLSNIFQDRQTQWDLS